MPNPPPSPRRLLAEAGLLFITFLWGATFPLVKGATESVPVFSFLALRFTLAALILWALVLAAPGARREAIVRLRKGRAAGDGVGLGTVLFLAFALQTFGLRTTTATKSAFITGMLALWTPVLTFLLWRRRPGLDAWFGVPLGLGGLFLLVMDTPAHWSTATGVTAGDGLTLLCSIMFAVHVVMTSALAPRHPALLLTAIQITAAAMLSAATAPLAGEAWGLDYPADAWGAIVFTAILATCAAFWIQTRAQPMTTEARAGTIFLMEPVFGAAMAFLLAGERLSPFQWGGAGAILVAVALPLALPSGGGGGDTPDDSGEPDPPQAAAAPPASTA